MTDEDMFFFLKWMETRKKKDKEEKEKKQNDS